MLNQFQFICVRIHVVSWYTAFSGHTWKTHNSFPVALWIIYWFQRFITFKIISFVRFLCAVTKVYEFWNVSIRSMFCGFFSINFNVVFFSMRSVNNTKCNEYVHHWHIMKWKIKRKKRNKSIFYAQVSTNIGNFNSNIWMTEYIVTGNAMKILADIWYECNNKMLNSTIAYQFLKWRQPRHWCTNINMHELVHLNVNRKSSPEIAFVGIVFGC